jgi:hypothetical protein
VVLGGLGIEASDSRVTEIRWGNGMHAEQWIVVLSVLEFLTCISNAVAIAGGNHPERPQFGFPRLPVIKI